MNQQDTQILINNLYFSLFLAYSTSFGRTTRPSSGALSSKLYHAIGTFVRAILAAVAAKFACTNVPIVLRDTVC